MQKLLPHSEKVAEENYFSSASLPEVKKIFAQLISDPAVFATKEELDSVKNKVASENRDGKINSIIEGTEFTERKLEEEPEYIKLKNKGVYPLSPPSNTIFHIDYISLILPEKI